MRLRAEGSYRARLGFLFLIIELVSVSNCHFRIMRRIEMSPRSPSVTFGSDIFTSQLEPLKSLSYETFTQWKSVIFQVRYPGHVTVSEMLRLEKEALDSWDSLWMSVTEREV